MITSVKNDKVKAWRKLHKRKDRTSSGTFLIEGFHLLEEAWKSNWSIIEIITQNNVELPGWCNDFPLEEVSDNVFQHISQTKSPQGIAAVIAMNETISITGNYLLLIDSIQDPGNLGTIIRTADAAGFDGIVLGSDTVDMYNEKVIRATQGSIFHIPTFQADLKEEIIDLKNNGYNVWATALNNAKVYTDLEVSKKVAIIVGNEGAGVREELMDLADTLVNIPIYGKAESLNVSVATGILMYYVKS
ncbi:RNA methyltransferase [Virgibacillus profundi]|uniref:RNA methyltransferase n=1 Tax=Virgibacillus profundi TaxID=2024555 RepID=A0A2A2IFW3_9BACI|nr:RNA methyltransferase [Virgibacillus profundi]PAV30432.1 RNA methyltransferase [Virgibacillus profundi]PXY54604.1 RNA methyltransferase [Virgibacillus profundi]